jgi:hypothetical protein
MVVGGPSSHAFQRVKGVPMKRRATSTEFVELCPLFLKKMQFERIKKKEVGRREF